MCGIIGIVGTSPVQDRLIESLKRLEYRGYDSAALVEKGNYRHFMEKEIHDQPDACQHTLSAYLDPVSGKATAPNGVDFSKVTRIQIIACGTAYYAGLISRYLFESLARLPVGELRTEGRAREVARAQGQLQKIDAARSAATGAWGTQPDGSVPPGQAACADLLERCFRLAHKILVRTEKAEAAGVGAEK